MTRPASTDRGPGRLEEAKPTPKQTHWRADVLAGIGHIRGNPELRRLVLAGAVVIEISGIGVAAQYSLVQALGEPPGFLGVLTAASARVPSWPA
ncbi:MAG: hypothetical protein ACYDH5_09045 [Acidimicrobiales bacterium]